MTRRRKRKDKRSFGSILLLITLMCVLLILLGRRGVIDLTKYLAPGKITLRVLFVGNSFTFYNDMPTLVADIAAREATNVRIEIAMEAVPAVSLEWHYNDGPARTRIAENTWDYVVLQDESSAAFTDPGRLSRYVQLFAQDMAHSKAIPVLFVTWADPQQLNQQEKINAEYVEAAEAANALVASVGSAFKRVHSERPSLELYDADAHHPSLMGSYLAARVIFGAIATHADISLSKGYSVAQLVGPARPAGVDKSVDDYFRGIGAQGRR